MDVLFEETDWLCYTCFHQKIAADGRALQGGQLALLPWENIGTSDCKANTKNKRRQLEEYQTGETLGSPSLFRWNAGDTRDQTGKGGTLWTPGGAVGTMGTPEL